MKRSGVTNYLLLLGIGIIWGSQFYFNNQAMKVAPPLTIAAARALIGCLTLTVLAWFVPEQSPGTPGKGKNSWAAWPLYLSIALLEAVLPLFLVVWGQQRVSSSVAAVLTGTVPFFTILLSALFIKGKGFDVNSTLSVLLGFLGVVALVAPGMQGNWLDNVAGDLAILTAAASFAGSLILLHKIPHGAPIRSMRNILLLASAPLLVLSLTLDAPWSLHWTLSDIASLLILGIFCSGLVYMLYTILIHRAGSVFTSLTNYLVPLVGVLLGVVFLAEPFTVYNGLALVLIAMALGIGELRTLSKSVMGLR